MKLRFSLLNLLLTTALVALSITVARLSRELHEERTLRTELLQKGGILEISDLDKVHVVSVSARHEPRTYRWRVYVPQGRSVTLHTSSKPCPKTSGQQARIRTKEIVSSDRMTADRIEIPPGEHLITYRHIRSEGASKHVYFAIDVRSDTFNRGAIFRSSYCDLSWMASNFYRDLTLLERPVGRAKTLPGSRPRTVYTDTTQCVKDKYFVLFRFRAHESKYDSKNDNSIPEAFAWLSIDG